MKERKQAVAYQVEFAEQARKLCELGATDAELASFFDCTRMSIMRWRAAHEEFAEACKVGKDHADDRVERSLYQRALGYSYEAQKVVVASGVAEVVDYREDCPPDTAACIFWLKNRRREEWRDKQEHEHTGKDGAPLVPIINLTGRPEPSSAS